MMRSQGESGRREEKRHVERKTGLGTEGEKEGRRDTREKRRIKGERNVKKEKGKNKVRKHLFDVDEKREE